MYLESKVKPKMKIIRAALFISLMSSQVSNAQHIYQHEEPRTGKIFLSETIAIDKEDAGYTLVLPDDDEAEGLVIFLNANREAGKKVDASSIDYYALQNNLGMLYITTGNRLEFFFEKAKIDQVDDYIAQVIKGYGLPKTNLFFGGMSLAGTRALKYGIYCAKGHSKNGLMPKAIAVCDSPLDMIRFWRETDKAERIAFNPITANEGEWVSAYLETNLGGTPEQNLAAYQEYSVYCYWPEEGCNTEYLRNIAIRAYTEPDVLWWMKTRRKDFYAMNAVDLAGMVNYLNLLGNDRAELIITHDKGYHPDGTRHPHSWSIVDDKELIEWFLKFLDN